MSSDPDNQNKDFSSLPADTNPSGTEDWSDELQEQFYDQIKTSLGGGSLYRGDRRLTEDDYAELAQEAAEIGADADTVSLVTEQAKKRYQNDLSELLTPDRSHNGESVAPISNYQPTPVEQHAAAEGIPCEHGIAYEKAQMFVPPITYGEVSSLLKAVSRHSR